MTLALRPSDAENLAGQETGREHLSHSKLKTLLSCEQLYDYSYEQRLEPVVKADPLRLGGAFQTAIEFNDPERGVEALDADKPFTYSQQDEDQHTIHKTVVRSGATAYLNQFGSPPNAEWEYRVRLRNPWTGAYSRTFDLLGFADGLKDLGDSWELFENKFVGQFNDVDIRRLPLDRQLALECYGIWRASGKPVTRVTYRFTRKPSIRQKQNESVAEYCERVKGDYIERPDFYMHEEPLVRSTDDLLRTEQELWQWAQMLRAARSRNFYTRNSDHCNDYKSCAFLGLCLNEPDAPLNFQTRAERPKTTTEGATQ